MDKEQYKEKLTAEITERRRNLALILAEQRKLVKELDDLRMKESIEMLKLGSAQDRLKMLKQ